MSLEPPEILSLAPIGRERLLASLRRVRLLGFDGARPYADARLELVVADPERLAPAQRYVLAPGVRRILRLREALLAHGVDVFALDGGVEVRTSWAPGETVPVLPPIVEESHEADGRTVLVVNDGIHRVFAARSLGLPIAVVTAHGVPPEYPYYACALAHGWADVLEPRGAARRLREEDVPQPRRLQGAVPRLQRGLPGGPEGAPEDQPGASAGVSAVTVGPRCRAIDDASSRRRAKRR